MLYQALEEMPNLLTSEDRSRLQPQRFFSGDRLLRQEDIIGYESELKRTVVSLMDTAKSKEAGYRQLLSLTKRLTDPQIGEMNSTQLNTLPGKKEFFKNLLGLLCDLHAQGDLVCRVLLI